MPAGRARSAPHCQAAPRRISASSRRLVNLATAATNVVATNSEVCTIEHVKARAVALLATGVIAGGVLATTMSANAADSSPSTPSAVTPSDPAGHPAHDFGSAPVRSDETALSSSLVTSLTKQAEAKTGGTVYRVESDAGDGKYEAHVKKSDGTLVTVTFDGSGNITAVDSGMGQGDPALGGRPGSPGGIGG